MFIPVSERKPEQGIYIVVITTVVDDKEYKRQAIAQYVPARTLNADDFLHEDSDFESLEYDEEADIYFVPEGFWENTETADYFGMLSNVTHWRPLLDMP